MKKAVLILIALLFLIGVAIGGYLLYKRTEGEETGESKSDIIQATLEQQGANELAQQSAVLAELEKQQLIAACKKRCGFWGIFSPKIRKCKEDCVKQYSGTSTSSKLAR